MEDNGLEPMTFWLPARERLGVNLCALWTYELYEKQVHCPVLCCLQKGARKCKEVQTERFSVDRLGKLGFYKP